LAQQLARQVAINAWFVLLVSMLIGSYVLALFGISLPVVRIGGGLLVAATAWRMLHNPEEDDALAAAVENSTEVSQADVIQRSFFPITFPLTTGPGTIAASIALSANVPPDPVKYALGVAVAECGAAIVSVTMYFIFKNSVAVLTRLGRIGTLVMIRMMAFILLCIGIEIMWTGWAQLNGLAH
jgi:multiple antibiotic resistance protein